MGPTCDASRGGAATELRASCIHTTPDAGSNSSARIAGTTVTHSCGTHGNLYIRAALGTDVELGTNYFDFPRGGPNPDPYR